MEGHVVDLPGFLTARLNEDNAEALKLHDRLDGNVPLQRAFAARMLREVEAKRKILDEHAMEPGLFPPSCRRCMTYNDRMDELQPETWPCMTVRAVAFVWSGYPDYDPAWKE
jgi:hypothetical protein